MIAARLRPGAISESSSSHLPPIEASQTAKPVVFPPGWLSAATRPLPTGSATPTMTIGIVCVSRWTATVAGVVFVTMMSGFKPTNSCASARVRLPSPPPHRKVYPHVAAIGPTQVRKRLRERGVAKLPLRIIFLEPHEHADAPYALRLLRPCRERPRRRAAEPRDKRAPFHSIT